MKTYLQILKEKAHNASEQTYRPALENLIKQTIKDISITNEAKSENSEIGTPDFSVYKGRDLFTKLVGFIECKKLSIDIGNLIDSPQIKKYAQENPNIILTNYKRFILIEDGKVKRDVSLCDDDFNDLKQEMAFEELLAEFYRYDYPDIDSKDKLVKSLAHSTSALAHELAHQMETLPVEHSFKLKFDNLYNEINNSLHYMSDIKEFIEVYSQSFIYGLFIVRLVSDKRFAENDSHILDTLPDYYAVLKEFLTQGFDSGKTPTAIKTKIYHIASMLNRVDIDKIKQKDQEREDLIIYLYEDYLKAYDKLERKAKGVYYTPRPAVSFIVRSLDEVLKTHFEESDGFLADGVKTLDFATGTGSFLLEILRNIIKDKNLNLKEKALIKKKVINDIYGFELLPAPYIIAHTYLVEYLAKYDIKFNPDEEKEKVQIYLTNTLDLSSGSISSLLPELKKEYEKSQSVKHSKQLMVVLGNPPYNRGSTNKNYEIIELIKKYKPKDEKSINNLNDDYIKFLAVAEKKITDTGYGVIGVITNNNFYSSITGRQMRKSFLDTFDEIYCLNLHGNSIKKEGDKNIFDIQVGVGITILIKHKDKKKANKLAKVFYHSTLANDLIKREEKFDFLDSHTLASVKWQELSPVEPYYFFVPKDFDLQKTYDKFWQLTDIFGYKNSGILTMNDEFCIHYTEKSLENQKQELNKLTEKEIEKKYKFTNDKRDWTIQKAKIDLQKNYSPSRIDYRPFDVRYTHLSKKSSSYLGRPRYELMFHLEGGRENVGISFERFNFYTYIANSPIDSHLTGDKTSLAPLYLYKESITQKGSYVKETNFTSSFKEKYLAKLDFTPTPEQVLSYIYAVMHSPSYRTKYLEFLKIDFPKVPMTTSEEVFESYARLGQELMDLHLLSKPVADTTIKASDINDLKDFVIAKIEYKDGILKLISTKSQEFSISGLTDAIYNYEIGSYKVIQKWLGYRKKDEVILTTEDFAHIEQMCISIKRTLAVVEEIGELGEGYLG